MKTPLQTPRHGKRVFLTGGTGFLGALMAAQALSDDWADHLVIPTRRGNHNVGIPEEVQRELLALGRSADEFEKKVTTVHWQGAETASVELLESMLRSGNVDTVVHCAGCLDYFDNEALQALNVDFTARLTVAAKQAGVSFFIFVSTAYSAGYSGGVVPETALNEPPSDPTNYTLTKRAAERVVAECGIPFLVVRPSIVIGSSADGRYSGKRYGLYQQWMGIERLLSDRHHAELHTVATDQALNLLHQDAFQASIASVFRWVPEGEYVNLVVDDQTSPSMKDLWRLFCKVTRPKTVIFYDSLQAVDLKAINIRQRGYLTFAQTNLEIGAYPWQFDRQWLKVLSQRGLNFTETTLNTLQICQDRFIRSSQPIQRYLERFGADLPAHTEYRDHLDAWDVSANEHA
ncbi:SDR family oxidoreductase [Pseudomonas sp. G2-4]|uniref:SDR family oxidoreductase n=1 Tax=Pseudomonas sp. G2-4 TaxID=1506334 RepID=UPI0024B961AF|nr:SDR family oxidoreductase [Pseudomonas sp. G2-4]WHS61115.1 SDR family oxidoreductase [Pseudomonas sp. G2-4]